MRTSFPGTGRCQILPAPAWDRNNSQSFLRIFCQCCFLTQIDPTIPEVPKKKKNIKTKQNQKTKKTNEQIAQEGRDVKELPALNLRDSLALFSDKPLAEMLSLF